MSDATYDDEEPEERSESDGGARHDDKVRQMARAEELTSLAARADTPAARVMFLQLASAFRHLGQRRSRSDSGH
ncbi:MAG: hypothetical protein WDM79_18740 [Terricaulis sp.]